MVGCNNNNINKSSFARTICSICYEDLKPIIEDLQSISVCGHVFHELCLQQWFEYCPNGKKRNCPVCKQTCTEAKVGRLYFQSINDPGDSSLSQKPHDYEENSEELRTEVKRLEGKVVGLGSALEVQQKEFKEVIDQLFTCKEQLKVEVTLKNEALSQKSTVQKLLSKKSEDLDKSTLERTKLQERNLVLAKELAALKLASDLNLEEDEVLKFASLGHDAGSKETVDVLRKSLVIRNKSYKELMAKCNLLGRGEARLAQKLERAKDKIKKLKLRVQELEIAIEAKDNEALRASKKIAAQVPNGIDPYCKIKTSSQDQMKEPDLQIDLDETSGMPDNSFCLRKMRKFKPSNPMLRKSSVDDMTPRSSADQNNKESGPILINEDEDMIYPSSYVQEYSFESLMASIDKETVMRSSHLSRGNVASNTNDEKLVQIFGNKDGVDGNLGDHAKHPPAVIDDEVICYGDSSSIQTSFHIRKETSVPVAQGDNCFSGGLLGPDGTNWHLGKWCKKAQRKESTTLSTGLQGSNASTGNLIAVGADGRGGRIKVLRSLGQSSSDIEDASSCAKKFKHVAKTNSSHSQGCLQIEHFFQRTGQ
ncbi:filamin A-interacting 1-like [Olea europaea subsp. europaea]|uniref:Filamin A-interacting 1-like n=1 Tax=Olea europaea subsp. europaea TaxID=158383 RepID=A0A8S0PAE4_OLEEU|nr:filamin A-interacting 1-like [Olea europaea subsp. europaea]